MNILILGGNGFLGNNLYPILSEYKVDRPKSSEINLLYEVPVNKFKNYDLIIYMAANYGGLKYNIDNRLQMLFDNTSMNLNFFKFISLTKPNRVISIGSACSYPATSNFMQEDKLLDGDCHSSIREYGYSKRWAIMAHKTLQKELNIQWDHICPANMYGPYDIFDINRSHLVGALIYKFINATNNVNLLGTGVAKRDVIYVEDVCEAIKLCIKKGPFNQVINIGSNDSMTVKNLAHKISNIINFKGNINWGDPSQDGTLNKSLDCSKAKQLLNWTPKTKINEGLQKTIKWYKQNNK